MKKITSILIAIIYFIAPTPIIHANSHVINLSKTINNNSDNNIKIDCNMGDIDGEEDVNDCIEECLSNSYSQFGIIYPISIERIYKNIGTEPAICNKHRYISNQIQVNLEFIVPFEKTSILSQGYVGKTIKLLI